MKYAWNLFVERMNKLCKQTAVRFGFIKKLKVFISSICASQRLSFHAENESQSTIFLYFLPYYMYEKYKTDTKQAWEAISLFRKCVQKLNVLK